MISRSDFNNMEHGTHFYGIGPGLNIIEFIYHDDQVTNQNYFGLNYGGVDMAWSDLFLIEREAIEEQLYRVENIRKMASKRLEQITCPVNRTMSTGRTDIKDYEECPHCKHRFYDETLVKRLDAGIKPRELDIYPFEKKKCRACGKEYEIVMIVNIKARYHTKI